MSEPLELVRRYFERTAAGDWENLEFISEDLLYYPIREITEAGEYRGRNGPARYWRDNFEEAWADVTFDVSGYQENGECVIARVLLSGHGRTSGLELSGRVFVVFTIRDGEIVKIEDFVDRAEALAAAGMAEQD